MFEDESGLRNECVEAERQVRAAEVELADAVRALVPVPIGDKLMSSEIVHRAFEKLRVAHAQAVRLGMRPAAGLS